MSNNMQSVYPLCSLIMGNTFSQLPDDQLLELPQFLQSNTDYLRSHPYLADLAKVEAARYAVAEDPSPLPGDLSERIINPNLQLIEVHWQGLPELILNQETVPYRGTGFVLVWKIPGEGIVQIMEADNQDLLALKLTSEKIDSRDAADQGQVTIGTIDDILYRAVQKGILIAPSSAIIRPPEFNRGEVKDSKYFTTPTFTLQWHITQTCDLHCRHCYDRSERPEADLDQCIRILDELYDFCRDHHVFSQINFTGGNPLLYPHFNELYKEAADRGFLTGILGNPMPRKRLDEILAIQKPEFFQVSLEGLQAHNDYIRGQGHFDRVYDFLEMLRELDIYSMVMLTLTRANIDQVLDLAELLKNRVDLFTFNRLAMVGEGAELASVSPDEFPAFLNAFLDAVRHNPSMGLKDNLMNILRRERNQPFFGGCAGRGCGAAFNFVALLPDGELHACRKFPSFIGNLGEQSFSDIYHGELASKYRAGSQECAQCSIRPVCGGCLAVAHGFGLDIFTERDPYCFIDSLQTA